MKKLIRIKTAHYEWYEGNPRKDYDHAGQLQFFTNAHRGCSDNDVDWHSATYPLIHKMEGKYRWFHRKVKAHRALMANRAEWRTYADTIRPVVEAEAERLALITSMMHQLSAWWVTVYTKAGTAPCMVDWEEYNTASDRRVFAAVNVGKEDPRASTLYGIKAHWVALIHKRDAMRRRAMQLARYEKALAQPVPRLEDREDDAAVFGALRGDPGEEIQWLIANGYEKELRQLVPVWATVDNGRDYTAWELFGQEARADGIFWIEGELGKTLKKKELEQLVSLAASELSEYKAWADDNACECVIHATDVPESLKDASLGIVSPFATHPDHDWGWYAACVGPWYEWDGVFDAISMVRDTLADAGIDPVKQLVSAIARNFTWVGYNDPVYAIVDITDVPPPESV